MLSDEKLVDIYVKHTGTNLPSEIIRALRAVAEAAVRAEREGAEPAAYRYKVQGLCGNMVWVWEPCGRQVYETEALYRNPPQASATVPDGVELAAQWHDKQAEKYRMVTARIEADGMRENLGKHQVRYAMAGQLMEWHEGCAERIRELAASQPDARSKK